MQHSRTVSSKDYRWWVTSQSGWSVFSGQSSMTFWLRRRMPAKDARPGYGEQGRMGLSDLRVYRPCPTPVSQDNSNPPHALTSNTLNTVEIEHPLHRNSSNTIRYHCRTPIEKKKISSLPTHNTEAVCT